MRPLPDRRLEDFIRFRVKVATSSTIRVRNNTYSVDSRLIREQVEARLYADHVEVRYGGQRVAEMPRLRGEGKHRIDYRHVIHSLVRKPGAFARYRWREDLFPGVLFRVAYDELREDCPQTADRQYLGILELAAQEGERKLPQSVDRQLSGLVEGDFLDRAENLLVFGNPGSGKTHLVCALGQELILRDRRVLFSTCALLVQRLLRAKLELTLERELKKLDRFEALIIDDIGYVQQNRDEMEILFTLLSHRYERRSILLTSNLVFSDWERIFKDPLTTAAASDRLVHHSVILELNVTSYRMEAAKQRTQKETK